jgi:hypothetical protein
MAGLQKRIAKTAAQPKPATERGAEIRALAGTLEEVTVEMARRFMVEKEGYPEKGVHPFGPVLDVDDKTVIIPAGARTVDEQSKLHGAEIAKRIIRPAIEGQSDLLELIKDLDRIRGKE